MKRCIFLVLAMQCAFIACGDTPTSEELVESTQRVLDRIFFSQGKQPGRPGTALVHSRVMSFPHCRSAMQDFVEDKMRTGADAWPQSIPLYLQIGGDPSVVRELLPSFEKPETVALAKLYLMIHGEPSGEPPRPIENENSHLKASIRHVGDNISVLVENVSDQSILFCRSKYSSLRVWRADGVCLVFSGDSMNKELEITFPIILQPRDRYEFTVRARLSTGGMPTMDPSKSPGWYTYRMGDTEFWSFDRTVVASGYDQNPVPLIMQFVYDPTKEISRLPPAIVESIRAINKKYEERVYLSHNRVLMEEVGIVSTKPIHISLPVPRLLKGPSSDMWATTQEAFDKEREKRRKKMEAEGE